MPREKEQVKEAKFDAKPLELGVIGFMLLFPAQCYEVHVLSEAHFHNSDRRIVFRVMKRMFESLGQSALETTGSILAACAGEGLDEDRCLSILTEANDYAPQTIAGLKPLRESLLTRAVKLALREAADTINQVVTLPKNIAELQSEALEAVNTALKQTTPIEVTPLADALQAEAERMSRFDEGVDKEGRGVPFGIKALDRLTDGAHGGELIILAARPSMGKTALFHHVAMSFGYNNQQPGVMFSLEMPRNQYVQRMISQRAKADIKKVMQRLLGPEVRHSYIEWAKKLKNANIYIHDKGGVTLSMVCAITRRLYHECGIRWVGVDYLQLMDHTQKSSESRSSAIGRTSNGLKSLAMSLQIPVIALSQLNRDCERRDNKRPRLSDLRESGDIEQDADVVAFLHRDWMYKSADEKHADRLEENETAEIIVAKQRNGPLGTASCGFQRSCAFFYDMEEVEEPGQ